MKKKHFTVSTTFLGMVIVNVKMIRSHIDILKMIRYLNYNSKATISLRRGPGGGGGGALGYLGGCIRSLSKLKNTPKALISGQKSTLILIKR